jgi:tetratricopeptide (TPR) repeat protein
MFLHRNRSVSGLQGVKGLKGLMQAAIAAALLTFSSGVVAQTADLQEINKLLKAGQTQVALDRVNVYLTTKPKDAVGRFIRGLAQAELGKTNDAIMTFQALTEDYPELPEPYNNLAVLYSSKGQFEKARVALELAIQTHPSYSTAHENLGDIYAKLASQAYDKALQLDKANGMVATKLNLVRDLFSTNPKANIAPRASAVTTGASAATIATGMTAAPLATVASATSATSARAPLSAPATTPTAPVAVPAKPAPTPVAPAAAAAVAPPAAVAKVDPPKPADPSADVLNAVNKWAKDWAGKNPDGYLAAYSKSFKPEDGSPRTTWNAARRERITTPKRIKVEVLGATVEMTSATEAKVTFRQAYSSDALQTRSRKTLTMVKEGGNWLIARERVG